MPGPRVDVVRSVALASVDESSGGALNVDHLRKLIAMIDAAQGVLPGASGYRVDTTVLDMLPPGMAQLVTASVARANVDPLAAGGRTAGGTVALASASNLDDQADEAVKELGGKIKDAVGVVARFKAVIQGTTAEARWSGLKLELTAAAASALVDVLSKDLPLLNFLTPYFPQAGPVFAVATVAGAAMGGWVESANAGKTGVVIHLYFWVVPWVDGRE